MKLDNNQQQIIKWLGENSQENRTNRCHSNSALIINFPSSVIKIYPYKKCYNNLKIHWNPFCWPLTKGWDNSHPLSSDNDNYVSPYSFHRSLYRLKQMNLTQKSLSTLLSRFLDGNKQSKSGLIYMKLIVYMTASRIILDGPLGKFGELCLMPSDLRRIA